MPIDQAPNNEHVDDLDEIAEVLPIRFSITSYGADYPVDGLVKRMAQNDIVVPTFGGDSCDLDVAVRFQRRFVWTKQQADRFIESLLLGLPVPGIFLVKESDGKLLVLDGQQRLRTLQTFYDGVFRGKEFALENVQEQWKARTYKTLNPDDRRRLDDSIIHATVMRQDEPSDDQSSIYLIFERLNSGGTFLQPQEIRVALYHGAFAELLSRLNENEDWRVLYGPKSDRLKDLELILRFVALFFFEAEYRRPMKEFLNRYMAANRDLTRQSSEQITELFTSTVRVIRHAIGDRAFRLKSTVNAAVLDSVMVGVAHRIPIGATADNLILQAYETLIADERYLAATTRSTADEENVKTRLGLAKAAFATA